MLEWSWLFNDDGGGTLYWQYFVTAWGWTLTVALLGLLLALVLGSVIGILRTVPHKGLAWFGEIWTELFRNVPLLVQMMLWYHVIPKIFPILKTVPGFLMAAIALGLFTSARIAEQVKAGIQALPRGQRFAGLALGFTLPQTYRHVLLPMAYRIILPPLTSESMNIVKNSSVAFAVSVAELTWTATQLNEETGRGIEVFLIVSVLYFVSAFTINRIMTTIEQRVRVPGFVGGGK